MNEIFVALFFVFVLFVLPWILLLRSRHLRKKAQQETEIRFSDLTARVYNVETQLESLRRSASASAESRPSASVSTVDVVPKVAPPVPPAPIAVPKPVVTPPPAASRPLPPPPVPAERPAPFAPRIDQPKAAPIAEIKAERVRKSFDIEEALGTNWLNKIGIILLVFGVAFFLAYQLKEMGPAGKVLVGFLVSAALLGGSVFLERKQGYVIIARAGIGGGWALTFFTTYAMYHVDAAKVLPSQGVDLVLMGIVAAGMVAHSLRYRSQVVTGLAFILAFSTVTISQVTVYSLLAGVVLAIALVAIILPMRWYELEVFGLLAAYLNHFYWLYHIVEPMGGHKKPFPEFFPSAAVLISYWLIFRVSYIVRKLDDPMQEKLSTVSALLNSFGLLVLLKYQSVHPEWAFWALLALGAAEVLLSLIVRPRRRMAFAVLASIGVTLLFAAIPFRYSTMSLSIIWVAGVESLLLVGIFTREQLFRRLSFVAAFAATLQMMFIDVSGVIAEREAGRHLGPIVSLGAALLFASVLFYFNSSYVRRRWSDLFEDDSLWMRVMSYEAALLGVSGLWIALPDVRTAPAWAIVSCVLGLIAVRMADEETSADFKIQADIIAVLAFLCAIINNFDTTATWTSHHISQRLVTILLCAAALYIGSRNRTPNQLLENVAIPEGYTWLASSLVGSLIWYELHSVSVAAAWALFGVVLLEVGLARKSVHLRIQGYIALLLSVVRVFTANLDAAGQPGEISPRLYSTLPVIFILGYVYWRLAADSSAETAIDRRIRAAAVSSWLALLTFAALVRFELQADWVAVLWAAFVPVLLLIAWRSERLLFLAQALFMVVACCFRAGLHNLYERSLAPAPFWFSQRLCVGLVCFILFASLAFAYRVQKKYPSAEGRGPLARGTAALMRRPEQLIFFAPFLLFVAMLTVEMSRGLLTVSWSIFGVVTFLFALWLGERSFRLAGMGLLLLGVAKIAVIDVWRLGPRDRYLTFISMGAAVMLVSFLWTHYREALRQYL